MTIQEKQQALIEDLSLFPDHHELLSYIIEKSKKATGLDKKYQTEEFRINGCQSNLWIVPEFKAGKCYFSTDSDAVITKSIAGILTEFYSGHTPEEIISCEPDFLAEVGITQHLTPNRRNGLSNVWARIKGFAEIYDKEKAEENS